MKLAKISPCGILRRDPAARAGVHRKTKMYIAASKQLMKVLEGSKHYPESSARIVSSGNGRALLAMYNAVIKPFMPAHTKQKLLVLGKDIEKQSNKDAIGFDEATFTTLLSMCGRQQVDVSDE